MGAAPYRFHRHHNGQLTLVDGNGGVEAVLRRCLLAQAADSHFDRLIAAAGDPARRPLDVLGRLPPSDRATFGGVLAREALAALGTEPFAFDPSSGSTDHPLARIYRLRDDHRDLAFSARVFAGLGVDSAATFVCLDVDAAPLHDFYLRAARLAGARRTALLLCARDLDAGMGRLGQLAPTHLLTVPSILSAGWSRAARLWEPGRAPVRAVVTIGEPTSHRLRDAVRRGWGATVTSFYGATEAGGIGAECGAGDGHHVDPRHTILTVTAGRHVGDEVRGELLITVPWQRTHPVIKYALGDLVRLSLALCPCGDPRPRLWVRRRIRDAFTYAGNKIDWQVMADALRRIAPDLAGVAFEIEDGETSQLVIRPLVPERLRPLAAELRQAVIASDHRLAAWCRRGLIEIAVGFQPGRAAAARKSYRVVDRRSTAPVQLPPSAATKSSSDCASTARSFSHD